LDGARDVFPVGLVHRCPNIPAKPEERAIKFEESALVLAQVGKALIETGLVHDNMLELIVWAVQTRYARDLWDAPGTADDCREPPTTKSLRLAGAPVYKVSDFKIPPRRRRI